MSHVRTLPAPTLSSASDRHTNYMFVPLQLKDYWLILCNMCVVSSKSLGMLSKIWSSPARSPARQTIAGIISAGHWPTDWVIKRLELLRLLTNHRHHKWRSEENLSEVSRSLYIFVSKSRQEEEREWPQAYNCLPLPRLAIDNDFCIPTEPRPSSHLVDFWKFFMEMTGTILTTSQERTTRTDCQAPVRTVSADWDGKISRF